MDLSLYARVLWRFRLLVVLGLLAACALAVLSVAKVNSNGLEYRKAETWQSQTTLILTQRQGFPWGRAIFPPAVVGKPYPYADGGRFASLTGLYAQFASSDEVAAMMRRDGAPRGSSLAAAPVQSSNPALLSPLISLFGKAPTPAAAVEATRIGTRAFLQYISSQQASAEIPENDRVAVRVLQGVQPAILVGPRKKTLPIVVFLTVMIATVSLAFILENVRPRTRVLPTVAHERSEVADARRSA